MIDFMNDVDSYAALNLPEKYDIKKHKEIYEPKEIEEEIIKKHIEENERHENKRKEDKIRFIDLTG